MPGRTLDDNAQIMLRYANGGARGMLWASQVAPGNENGLRLRVYGTKGGIDWVQADPNDMLLVAVRPTDPHRHPRRRRRGAAAARVTRVPPGHPEGYLEGFANIYAEVALAIKAARVGQEAAEGRAFPDDRGRRQRRRLHRGGGQIVESQRPVGEAVKARRPGSAVGALLRVTPSFQSLGRQKLRESGAWPTRRALCVRAGECGGEFATHGL